MVLIKFSLLLVSLLSMCRCQSVEWECETDSNHLHQTDLSINAQFLFFLLS